MWSTSPAERTVSVPPFVEQDVGVGGAAVDTPRVPLGAETDVPLWPQPAAAAARPTTAMAARMDFMTPPFEPMGLIRDPRVERVADAVAEEVEGEDGENEGRPGEDEVPPGGAEDRGGLGDHLPPARLGRVDADAEVRERRLEQDVLRDDQRRVDDDRCDEVRQDLAEEDRSVRSPACARGLDEGLFANREDLAPDDAPDVRPVDDDDRHDHRRQAGLDEALGAAAAERAGGGDPEREQQDRKRERDVDEARDGGVDEAAVVAGDHPQDDAAGDRVSGRHQGHLERDAGPVEHAREDVLAERVDAEEEALRRAARGPECRVERARILRVRRVREPLDDERGEDRRQHLGDDEAEGDERHAVAAKALPEELPRRPPNDARPALDDPILALLDIPQAGRGAGQSGTLLPHAFSLPGRDLQANPASGRFRGYSDRREGEDAAVLRAEDGARGERPP